MVQWKNPTQYAIPDPFQKQAKYDPMKIYVKNMACESCKVVVKDALEELDISPVKVELGEIETKEGRLSRENQKSDNWLCVQVWREAQC